MKLVNQRIIGKNTSLKLFFCPQNNSFLMETNLWCSGFINKHQPDITTDEILDWFNTITITEVNEYTCPSL